MNTLPATKEIILEVRNLNFFYGAFQGLKNINLDIQKNTVTAFIGPSGCGKSTLLRTLNRMYDLYPGQRAEGEINFDGENILNPKQDLNLLRSRIGMVFQKPTPFPMSIYDNIAFGVRLYEDLSRSEMDDRVEWALQKAAIWDEVKNKLKQMRKVWHDERREKESAQREQQETLNVAQRLLQENKRIKNILSNGEKEYVATVQNAANMELEMAKRAYREAYDAGDTDKIIEAQQSLQNANYKIMQVKNFKLPPLQEEQFEVQPRQEQQQHHRCFHRNRMQHRRNRCA